ncbi:hypothetical protein WN944_009646 [Citrus x changshan-huyou]|uniref:Uncharacterized protein n=1 Tax=Citrus x changshan-huyou TaxID=2935761 RepID=A0AAP0MQ69_9ROSI
MNRNRNGGAHHYLGMENGRLIPMGSVVGLSLSLSPPMIEISANLAVVAVSTLLTIKIASRSKIVT